jgi:hypothetical protein
MLLFTVFLFSCATDDDTLPPNPRWLNDKIELLKVNGFPGTTVYAYHWKSTYFYYIMNPISSCAFCEFYSYSGTLNPIGSDDFDDFNENAKMVKAVWEK